jgi:hypothetical protein
MASMTLVLRSSFLLESRMHRKDVGRARLEQLSREEHGYANVARIAGVSADNLWQILNNTPLPSGRPRGLGDQLAEKLERAFGKPPGWFDQPVSEVAEVREEANVYGVRPN